MRFTHFFRGDVAYREVIPLRAAVESLDQYQNILTRGVYLCHDLFVKVLAVHRINAAIMICQFEDIQALDDEVTLIGSASALFLYCCLTKRLGNIGEPQVLTRINIYEIVNILQETTFVVHIQSVDAGPHGVCEITMYFFSLEHRSLFDFALHQSLPLAVPEGVTRRLLFSVCIIAVITFMIFLTSLLPRRPPTYSMKHGGETTRVSDDKLFHIIYPFYNEQMV